MIFYDLRLALACNLDAVWNDGRTSLHQLLAMRTLPRSFQDPVSLFTLLFKLEHRYKDHLTEAPALETFGIGSKRTFFSLLEATNNFAELLDVAQQMGVSESDEFLLILSNYAMNNKIEDKKLSKWVNKLAVQYLEAEDPTQA